MKKYLYFLFCLFTCMPHIVKATRKKAIEKLQQDLAYSEREKGRYAAENDRLEKTNQALAGMLQGESRQFRNEKLTFEREFKSELNKQETLCCLSSCCLLSVLIGTNIAWYVASTIDKDKNQ